MMPFLLCMLFSGIGVLGSLYVCTVVVIKYFTNGPAENIHVATSPDTWQDVFIAVPAICFGFQCHISSIPVYASLKKRTVAQFSKVCVIALFLAFTVYTLTGIFGSLTYGTSSCSDILKSYDADDVSMTIARIMIAASVLTAYPILHFCGRYVNQYQH
ncbi:putative sodium-coupled neutral amino acid transporter 7, partial [Anneissia japonica]|uniref:putative sodium-coupled neutral amino acid transporter 7 n=1 Tax=Anneissia japonica TaxID=1529436 RepID=UPI00142561DE